MRTRRSARFQEVEMIDRRKLLLQTFGAAGLVAFAAPLAFADDAVLVYKSPTCGCCAAWIEHLRAAGFSVRANNVVDMSPVKTRLRVRAFASVRDGVRGIESDWLISTKHLWRRRAADMSTVALARVRPQGNQPPPASAQARIVNDGGIL